MKLKYLAHADNGIKVLTDPYTAGTGKGKVDYLPITEDADIITVSHKHADHCFISSQHQKTIVLTDPKKLNLNNISFSGFSTFHDKEKGIKRGGNIN